MRLVTSKEEADSATLAGTQKAAMISAAPQAVWLETLGEAFENTTYK